MKVTEYMMEHGHEELAIWTDKEAGLRSFIAIHDRTLGPSLGGVRIWPHKTEDAAITDVLRLSRAMTYKSAVAGLPLGGGKAVIMADPNKDKTPIENAMSVAEGMAQPLRVLPVSRLIIT